MEHTLQMGMWARLRFVANWPVLNLLTNLCREAFKLFSGPETYNYFAKLYMYFTVCFVHASCVLAKIYMFASKTYRFKINIHVMDTTRIEIKFNPIPALIMSLMSICPLPNITAFGGVDIGNINAQLAAMVVGIIKYSGFALSPIAKIISIGVNVATVAVFELSSVKNIITKTEIKIKK